MPSPGERYLELSYKEGLERTHLYPSACKELSLILNDAYRHLPKIVQSAIFQDILSAFRLLPGTQTSKAISAAHSLYQSVESSLPKQKKNIAVKEFKIAMIAQKRSNKAPKEDEALPELPEDILLQIFDRLDMQSLASCAQVCQSWHFVATNNGLWKSQFCKVFSEFSISSISLRLSSCRIEDKKNGVFQNTDATPWRILFKDAYKRESSEKLLSNRGYCNQCQSVVWLENMSCWNRECGVNSPKRSIINISFSEVVPYLLYGCSSLFSSSSDSESDEDFPFQFFTRTLSM